jgi:hypothetical protein
MPARTGRDLARAGDLGGTMRFESRMRTGAPTMDLQLEDEEAIELRRLLTEALSELGSEIADTDNASFRRTLRARRELLEGVRSKLVGAG